MVRTEYDESFFARYEPIAFGAIIDMQGIKNLTSRRIGRIKVSSLSVIFKHYAKLIECFCVWPRA